MHLISVYYDAWNVNMLCSSEYIVVFNWVWCYLVVQTYIVYDNILSAIRANGKQYYGYWTIQDFDRLNSDRINVSQFRRALDALQISSLGRLFLFESEITDLIELYKDPNDPDRVCWRTFEDDIDKGAI